MVQGKNFNNFFAAARLGCPRAHQSIIQCGTNGILSATEVNAPLQVQTYHAHIHKYVSIRNILRFFQHIKRGDAV